MATIKDISKKYFDELFYAKDRLAKLNEIIDRVNSLEYEGGGSISNFDKKRILDEIRQKIKTTVPIIKEADNKRHLDSINHTQSMLDKLNERLSNQIDTYESSNTETKK
jgi:hypothetical protein